MRRVWPLALVPIALLVIVATFYIQGNAVPHFHARASTRQSSNPDGNAYIYYTLKQTDGFVLARALKGAAGQPIGTPEPIAPFGNEFGLLESDNVLSMQLSPDGRYLAIDGTQDHGEQVWVYDTQRGIFSLVPPNVMGNFLHWLPGANSHTFFYRPMFPLGPDAPMDGGTWNPGLWEVDAATGAHKNIDIGMSSAYLVDAAASPDGTHIIYSTTLGLGMGSDTWLMNSDGSQRTHLFSNEGGAQSIAGFFTWSPDGTMIAYERLSDSPIPFLPAGLWVMNNQGSQQHHLIDVDGGHGYAPVWSPDGRRIAFVQRTNVGDRRADTNVQSLQSAIAVIDITTGQSWVVASSAQTGVQINTNPAWSPDGSSITFIAFNPINRVLGGTPRYWSARVTNPQARPSVVSLTPALTHIVAIE